MYAYLLNTSFETTKIIDTFESFIWTDRYQEAGDFEIYTFPSKDIINDVQQNYYLVNPESDHTMIVESREIKTDLEVGNKIIITGHSLEYILHRRVIIDPITINGSLQDGIEKILNVTIINPDDQNRKINNFIFIKNEDIEITKLILSAQYEGENIYDVICDICKTHEIGFKITLTSDNKFAFKLYKGKNRSYNQDINPYVIFSPSFENIINSSYIKDIAEYANTSIVVGDTKTYGRMIRVLGNQTGLNRREIYTDARSISDTDNNQQTIPKNEYINTIESQGREDLRKSKIKEIFDGQVETTRTYVYGIDFFLGDTVQIVNEYDMEGTSFISEIIWTQDDSGITVYPTFVSTDMEEEI